MPPSYDSDPFRYLRGRPDPRSQFIDDIARLFLNGEQGLWLDPSNLSTLFQDTAGAIQATAPGQTVALARDKSGRGNHLVQPVALSRPTLGRHPVGGRRNLLTYTEEMAGANWVSVGSTRADQGGGVVALTESTETGGHNFRNSIGANFGAGVDYTLSVDAKASVGTRNFRTSSGNAGIIDLVAVFDLVAGAVVSGSGASISSLGDGWHRCTVTRTAIGGITTAAFGMASGTAASYAGDGVSTILLRRPQLVPGTDPGAYQRVTSDWDVTEAGKADCWYLGFDGVDDFMVTAASIDLSATDKVTIFAGVAKITDAAIGMVAEFSANAGAAGIAGTFYLLNGDGTRRWSTYGRGTIGILAYEGTAAPDAAVLTASHDIAGDLSTIRRNGVAGVGGAGDMGAGNFGNHLMYVGRRAGTSLPFNGRIYQLPIRGAATSDAQVAAVEAQIAAKMGITL